jgi:hypothetical protein
MVIDYSAEGGFKEALQKTFDGRHPCALCKRIAGGKRSEKRTEFRLDTKKFEFSHLATTFIFRAPAYFWEVDAPASSKKSLTHSPPSPPPRLLSV